MLPASISGVFGPVTLRLQKYSPEILTVVGLASMTAGAFVAVKATTKLESVVAEAEARISDVKETRELAIDNNDAEVYSDANYRKDLYSAYLKNALAFTKLYGPGISMFVSGGIAIAVGHGILAKRNVALVAAYNAVEKSFAAYRARVLEDLGPDKDRDYRYGITETSERGEDGKKVTSTVVDPTKASMYARVFDESNPNWQHESGYNQFFLNAEQNYINDKLIHTGHVFLNEVYDRLGFERTPEGAVVGWIIKKGSDNFIDFDIYNLGDEAKRKFVNGQERNIFLDFNHDGVIFDKIGLEMHKSDPRRRFLNR